MIDQPDIEIFIEPYVFLIKSLNLEYTFLIASRFFTSKIKLNYYYIMYFGNASEVITRLSESLKRLTRGEKKNQKVLKCKWKKFDSSKLRLQRMIYESI